MQDAYAGDVGDFGKFVLLDAVARSSGGLKIGINWYYVPSPRIASNDGKHTGYLDPSNGRYDSFRSCSHRIFDALSGLIASRDRTVAGLEALRLLPRTTRYFSTPVPLPGKARSDWFTASMIALFACEIVFLDPDNGIQPAGLGFRERRSVKYALLDEIASYYHSGKSVIVYNHRDRSPKSRYDERLGMVASIPGIRADVQIIRFRRFSVRDYLFLVQSPHRAIIRRAVGTLCAPPLDFLCGKYIPEYSGTR
jgi:hypothetical protein